MSDHALPTFGIQYQLLFGTIEVGKLNKARNLFVGVKEDCTEQVLRAVSEMVKRKFDGGATFTAANGEVMTITIAEAPADANG